VPSSIHVVLYWRVTKSFVPCLCLAGTIPGVILASLFMRNVQVRCLPRQMKGGTPIEIAWSQSRSALTHFIAPTIIFAVGVGWEKAAYAPLPTPPTVALRPLPP
jgi:TRAP-type C4-dicarboxylate transport system permease large subunit